MTKQERPYSRPVDVTVIALKVLTCVCLAPLLFTSAVKTLAQEKPRLKDFGVSLKKESKKKRDEPPSSKQDSGDADEVIRVRTDLVVCDVMVVNNQGDAILGLDRSDFVISEDGKQQEAGTFSLGDAPTIPRSIVLILDYSGSQRPYIKTSVDAAKTLVDKLGPQDRMALVTDDVQLLVDFTQDKGLLKEKLEALKKRALSLDFGKSRQYDALMATLNEMFSAEDTRPIIIFQTDGDQLTKLRGFSYRDVFAAVERSRVTIYTIIPRSFIGLSKDQQVKEIEATSHAMSSSIQAPLSTSSLESLADSKLKEHTAIASLAKLSGGWFDSLDTPAQADEVYGRIFADINNRYVIGYYPINKERDGKKRNVKIEVSGHPEYIVWGRKTYFAPAQ